MKKQLKQVDLKVPLGTVDYRDDPAMDEFVDFLQAIYRVSPEWIKDAKRHVGFVIEHLSREAYRVSILVPHWRQNLAPMFRVEGCGCLGDFVRLNPKIDMWLQIGNGSELSFRLLERKE